MRLLKSTKVQNHIQTYLSVGKALVSLSWSNTVTSETNHQAGVPFVLETRFSSTTNLAPPGVFNNQFINPPVLIAALKHNIMRTAEGFLYKQMGSAKPQNNSISWIVLSALPQDPKAKCIHPGHKMLHQSCLDFWPHRVDMYFSLWVSLKLSAPILLSLLVQGVPMIPRYKRRPLNIIMLQQVQMTQRGCLSEI